MDLRYPNPSCYGDNGKEIPMIQIKADVTEGEVQDLRNTMKNEKWQGKFLPSWMVKELEFMLFSCCRDA